MSIKISTALRDHLLVTGSLYDALNGFLLHIYGGTVPTVPEDEAGSTPLCTISTSGSGTGLAFETSAINGMLTKLTSATWSGTTLDDGTATFYRLIDSTDDHNEDTGGTKIRVQGTVGVAGADLNVTNTAFVTGAVKTIDYYVIGLLTA